MLKNHTCSYIKYIKCMGVGGSCSNFQRETWFGGGGKRSSTTHSCGFPCPVGNGYARFCYRYAVML